MQVIFNIAVNELKKLFYSPIAWLVLTVFAFQCGMSFIEIYNLYVTVKTAGSSIPNLTFNLYASPTFGFYKRIPEYLYILVPLLTMNIISRDKGTGSIKLLFSSPVSNRQIILGKYLSLVTFSFLLTTIVFLFGLFGMFTIEKIDTPVVFSGLLGFFLLSCAYSAIGLFMSSITTHPIVAVIGTLCLLVFLNFAGQLWQETAIVRDITYWLSLKNRIDTFIVGLITSEDVIYFLAVITFFLILTLIRMNAARTKSSRLRIAGQYAAASVCMMLIGYVTSMPSFKSYWDITRTKANTLSKESQLVMSRMNGGVTISTYSNMLDATTGATAIPMFYKIDVGRFEKYLRFKPETAMDYTYYYKKLPTGPYAEKYPNLTEQQLIDTITKLREFNFTIDPYSAIAGKADLTGEQFRFVRVIERENGQKTFLRLFNDMVRHPDEAQITASFKRLVDTLPKVAFVTGHGERSPWVENERGYNKFAQEKTFRYSLINNGFDFEEISLTAPVPAHISCLIVADPRQPFSETERNHFNDYIAKGGNLIIAGEPGRQDIMNGIAGPLGIHFVPGTLIQPKKTILPEVLIANANRKAPWSSPWMKNILSTKLTLIMNGASGLEARDTLGFTANKLFISDSLKCWSELETTDFVNDSAVFNQAAGELKKPYVPVIALSRKIQHKEQKIIVTGDADWLSNGELQTTRKEVRSANFPFICAAFYWLSDGAAPINTERDEPIDNNLLITREQWKLPRFIFKWGIPFILISFGTVIWFRRRAG